MGTPHKLASLALALMAMASAQAQIAAPPAPGQGQPARQGTMSTRKIAPLASPEMIEARNMVMQQRWSEASTIIESNLEKRPRDAQWRFLQGVLFAEIGKRADAIRVFEQLTDDFPELSEPYNNLAALYVDGNEPQKARILLERAIQNRPDYAIAHENLGDIYARLAIASYENALKASQPSPSVKLKMDYLLQMPAIRSTRILTNR